MGWVFHGLGFNIFRGAYMNLKDRNLLNKWIFDQNDQDENLMVLNAIVMQSKEALTKSFLELIRSGYGLTGIYKEDHDLLHRLRLLENQIESLNPVVVEYFRDFKLENSYYKKFSIMCEADTLGDFITALKYLPFTLNQGNYRLIQSKDISPQHIIFKGWDIIINDPYLVLTDMILCDSKDHKLQVKVNLTNKELVSSLECLNVNLTPLLPSRADLIGMNISIASAKDLFMTPNKLQNSTTTIPEIIYNQGALI